MDEVILQMIDSFVAMADIAVDPSFQAFRSTWLKTKMPLLFEIRLDQEPMDLFLERIFCHFMNILLNLNPYEKKVLFAWTVFSLYSIFLEQPAKPRYRIPLPWNDWSGYLRLMRFASQSADLQDAWFVLYQLYNLKALKYCIARRCAPVAPPYQQPGAPDPLHRLIDVDNLRRLLEEYDEEAAWFRDELQLKTAQVFDYLEELEDILLPRPAQQTCENTSLPQEPELLTETNMEIFNSEPIDNDSPLFLSYRREDDQSSTDYDELS